MKESHNVFKVLLLGDAGVGKRALITRSLSGFPVEDLKQTIGVDFYTKNREVNGQNFTLKIWIIARYERFRFILSRYCKGSNGAFILYDITNPSTLEFIPEWTQILRKEVENIPILLVGTKLDLEKSRSVSREDALELVKSEGINEYIECSMITGENIETAFDILIKLMSQQSYTINYS